MKDEEEIVNFGAVIISLDDSPKGFFTVTRLI